MDEALRTAMLLGIGFAVGAVCGWQLRTMRYAKETRRMVEEIRRDRDDRGAVSWTFNRVAICVLFVIMLISVGLSAKAASESARLADRNEATIDCTQEILQQTVVALNQRTTYSNRSASAAAGVRKAFSDLITESLSKSQPSEEEARKIVRNLGDALREADEVTKKAKHKRDSFPYPTVEQIKNCPPR